MIVHLLYKAAGSLLCVCVPACVCVSVVSVPLFSTRPSDHDQIWLVYVDTSGNSSNVNKFGRVGA